MRSICEIEEVVFGKLYRMNVHRIVIFSLWCIKNMMYILMVERYTLHPEKNMIWEKYMLTVMLCSHMLTNNGSSVHAFAACRNSL